MNSRLTSIFSVYKATCLANGKSYVGFDSDWPCRKEQHRRQAGYGSKYKFHRAIRKHGFESFEWEVLYQSLDREHCLKTMEPYFIALHDSFHSGYNSTLGGEGTFGRILSYEAIGKMVVAKLGQSHTESTRAKISASRKGKGVGRVVTGETKLKLRVANLGRKHLPEIRAKCGAANVGRKFSPEVITKIVTSRSWYSHSQATREKISATKRERKQGIGKSVPASVRAKIRAKLAGIPRTEETKAKMRASWVARAEAARLNRLSKETK